MNLTPVTLCVIATLEKIGASQIFTITKTIEEVAKELNRPTEDVSDEVYTFILWLHSRKILMSEKKIPGPHSPIWIPKDSKDTLEQFLETKDLTPISSF